MPRHFASPLPFRRHLPLLGVLLLALALRIWGLTWGLPSATHYFSYHPDESVVLEAASLPNMSVFAGRLLPHFYNYGSLQLYLVCFANTLAMLFGAVDIVPKEFPGWTSQWAKMYLIGRFLTVSMGVGTVFAVYSIGKRLWGRRAGLLGALALAAMPLHAQHSHFLTVDVSATFWETLSLLWAVRLATGAPKPWRAVLWAGVFAGLAAATKYNLALAILPLVMACILEGPTPPQAASPPVSGGEGGPDEVLDREEGAINHIPAPDSLASSLPQRGSRLRWGWVLLGLAAFILAFLVACPGAILEHDLFWRDLRFEAVHVQNRYDPTFRDTGNGFVYHVARNLDAGLGLPLLILALVSIGYALYRRERGDGLLAAFALPYYVLISLVAVRYARYTIPLLPILALWVGRMAAAGTRLPQPSWRRWFCGAVAVVLGCTLVDAGWLVHAMADTDSRDEALTWIKAHASAKATFGFASMPWFGTVQISPYFSMPEPGAWQTWTSPAEAARYIYAGQGWDLALLKSANPDFVILSEFDYDDALRRRDPRAIAYVDYLMDSNDNAYFWDIAYSPDDLGLPKWVGEERTMKKPWVRSLQTRDLPHDMLYPSPTIYIFSHTPPGAGARE